MRAPDSRQPNMEGEADARFYMNPSISLHQARWLEARRKCFFCFDDMRDCKRERGERRECPYKSTMASLEAGSHDGAPGWAP